MFTYMHKVASRFLVGLSTLVFAVSALAQEQAAAPAGAPQAPPVWMQFVPFAVIIFVFYFFIIRPQAKKHKEQQNFNSSLKAGDQVVTNSGLLGKITSLNGQIVNLEIAQGVQIKLLRSQVAMLQSALQNSETAK